jgi:ataxia telangiectasia mutated family protein
MSQIMFEVYSNVEDPDGFYGIKTHDVRDALRRRVDHEGHHLRAFGLNGAAIEASATTSQLSSSLVATLHNFHEIGLNRLAGTLMRPLLGAQDQTGSFDPLFFELAWRTGDWDLPLTAEAQDTSAGTFYSAFRAVHRERDVSVVKTAVQDSIRTEMGRLRNLGMERMTEIKKSNANLLCLREVALWQAPETRRAIEEADFGGSVITRFAVLHPFME